MLAGLLLGGLMTYGEVQAIGGYKRYVVIPCAVPSKRPFFNSGCLPTDDELKIG